MPGWIREAETSLTPRASSTPRYRSTSSVKEGRGAIRAATDGKSSNMVQSSLLTLLPRHPTTSVKPAPRRAFASRERYCADKGDGDALESMQQAREVQDSIRPNNDRKRSLFVDEDESICSDSPLKRRKRMPNVADEEAPESNKKASETSIQRRPSYIFGPVPTSQIAPSPITPKRKKMRRTRYSAISPTKRKALIADSGRDVAKQQDLLWKRSSTSPLQNIDNVAHIATRSSSRESEAKQLTPSKLRHGYSLMALDEDLFNMLDESVAQAERSETESEGNSPSPSNNRVSSRIGLQYTRSPHSRKRIYAMETQVGLPMSNSIDAEEVPETMLSPGKLLPDAITSEILVDEQSLSSPPPESDAKLNEPIHSSQTAPGGSFSLQQQDSDAVVAVKEQTTVRDGTASSESDSLPDWRCQGDETYHQPSSQDFITPGREGERRSLRSSSKTVRRRQTSEDTQVLPWSDAGLSHAMSVQDEEGRRVDVDESQGSLVPAGSTSSKRTQQSWKDLRQVWSGVQSSLSGEEEVEQQSTTIQPSLMRFGFLNERSTSKQAGSHKVKPDVELSRDVDFDTDEEVESDLEQDDWEETHDEPASTMVTTEEGDETQPLAWDSPGGKDCEPQEDPSTDVMSLEDCLPIPDESDLDSQTRQFLERY